MRSHHEVAVGSTVFVSDAMAPSCWNPATVVRMPRSGQPKLAVRRWGHKWPELLKVDQVKHRMDLVRDGGKSPTFILP
jgi:hypothetical protein